MREDCVGIYTGCRVSCRCISAKTRLKLQLRPSSYKLIGASCAFQAMRVLSQRMSELGLGLELGLGNVCHKRKNVGVNICIQ